MSESSNIINDLNKVFIPCRTVLEMEALVSLYLLNSNYDRIKDVPESRPTSQKLIDILGMRSNQLNVDIIDYFINCAIPKVKPIVTYEREHHDMYRMGNVVPYSKTRVCVYLALHRLKLKFLIIKNIIDKLKKNNFELKTFSEYKDSQSLLLTIFAEEYYKKNKTNLTLMFPKSNVSERVKGLIKDDDSITGEKLMEMATSKEFADKNYIIKFIMREIKASIFVCKLMFAKMDLHNPFFSRTKDIEIDAEETMISNDFIPELIPAISKSLKEKNFNLLNDCVKAFYFLMDKVLEAINNAIDIASKGQIKVELYDTIFESGNILTF